ncbi:MAG: trypsin-like peptidase domain-containing protein [Ignavibacteriae bacterium]|nr:trypsin-like peptidase domain-containing protein [Ignavibacteriota bacterium]
MLLNRLVTRLIGLVLVYGTLCPFAISQDIKDVVRRSSDGVVMLRTYGRFGELIALGSASMVRSDGVLLTNAHVIEKAFQIEVKFPNGDYRSVTHVIHVEPETDFAVLKVDTSNVQTLPLGNSDSVQIGERVVAIGNPQGLEHTVSDGIISAVRLTSFEPGTMLQTTAAISHGSSGGALINMKGELIGVITFLIAGQNLNFAIPINAIKSFISDTTWIDLQLYAEQEFLRSSDYFLLGARCTLGAAGPEESLPLFQNVLAMDSLNTNVRIELAAIYEALHDTALSINEYIEVIRLEPENSKAHFGLGKHLALHGQKAEALQEYQILKGLDDLNAQQLFSLIYPQGIGKER